jgi:hypothetical protein
LRRYPIEIPQAQKISERKPADSLDSLPIEGSSKPVMGPNNYDD